MGTIQPNSNIILLKGVPLYSDYNETVYWSAEQGINGQVAGFMTYPNKLIRLHMYQRINEGIIRVNLKSDTIYNYNYMIFKNVGYTSGSSVDYADKWFFAFIKEVQYVNEQACNILYEIDEIQTWWFEAILNPSYVEREHSATDNIGEHLLAEPIDNGTLICQSEEVASNNTYPNGFFETSSIVIFETIKPLDEGENPPVGYLTDGIYSALHPWSFLANSQGVQNLNSHIEALIEDTELDRVCNIVMYPTAFIPNYEQGVVIDASWEQFKVARPTSVDGYTPRNKKLLSAPYSFFMVDVQTDSRAFKYELFNNPAECTFSVRGTISPNPALTITPYNYNGNYSEQGKPSRVEMLTMDSFPQCGVGVDGYRAYLAQESTNYIFSQLGQVGTVAVSGAGLVAGLMTGTIPAIVGGLAGVVGGIAGFEQNEFNNNKDQNKGSSTRGIHGSDGTYSAKLRNIVIRKMCVKAENARMIDDFFSRYGYTCERIKTPNRNVREHWTYTKTINVSIIGNIPSASMRKIKTLYDRGITFFNSIHNVGNYGLSNNPL